MTLINKFFSVAVLTVSVAAGGAFSPVFAGPEPIMTSGKDKVMQEIVPVCDPRWYISIGGDAEINFGGDNFVNGHHENFAFGNFVTGSVDIDSHDFDDVYDNPFYSIEGEFGYVLTRHIELFGTFRYSASIDNNTVKGSSVTVNVLQQGTFNFPLRSDFSDYRSYGGEIGIRYFFLPKEARLRPYISLSGGVSYVDPIGIHTRADFTSIGGPADVEIFHGAWFDGTVVGTGAALFGLEYRVNCHWALGLNAGVRYESALDDRDRDLDNIANLTGGTLSFLKGLNDDGGDRWTVPVTGYVKFRF